jgi:ATP-binding cassette, subfamily B, bacterial CvaB/MchF/RaxB
MQDDYLLSGSIADNICFFDADYSQDKLFQCARLAAIHNEIMAMPNQLRGSVLTSRSQQPIQQRRRKSLAETGRNLVASF